MHNVTKDTPIQFINGKWHIKIRKGCKISLSGYYTCLSFDLLLMPSGWMHQHFRMKQFRETRHTQAWFKK